jgi:Na+:H+ antiporter, NhaA family
LTEPPISHSWLSSDRTVPRLIARPVRTFLHTEAAGGVVLLGATIVALAWANLAGESYSSLWSTELSFQIGEFTLAEDLRHWVNDALMAIFFFVVGLEIKRELVVGELNSVRRAALPAFAALGGMVLPALLYAALNSGGPGSDGWGIPMATDIAFAVGVLALLSKRVPAGLKVFLLSLAIVDDIGAILVIAIFYSEGLALGWLALAIVLLLSILVLRRMRVYWVPVYVIVGSATWLATLESGVHATIAGVALGLLTPARPTDPGGFADVVEDAGRLPAEPDAETLRDIHLQAQEVVPVAERLEHLLHPWTSYLIVPLFALANAGVVLTGAALADAASSPIALGIVLGLVVGKCAGISLMSWIAIRLGWAEPPAGVTWRHMIGTAAIAGIGFTVSLFITSLAFERSDLVETAKIGVFAASLIAGVVGAVVLWSGAAAGKTPGDAGSEG